MAFVAVPKPTEEENKFVYRAGDLKITFPKPDPKKVKKEKDQTQEKEGGNKE